MTFDNLQEQLTALVAELETVGDSRAAAYVAQAKLYLRRAQDLVEPEREEAA